MKYYTIWFDLINGIEVDVVELGKKVTVLVVARVVNVTNRRMLG